MYFQLKAGHEVYLSPRSLEDSGGEGFLDVLDDSRSPLAHLLPLHLHLHLRLWHLSILLVAREPTLLFCDSSFLSQLEAITLELGLRHRLVHAASSKHNLCCSRSTLERRWLDIISVIFVMCSPTAVVGQKITALSVAVALGLEQRDKCLISALSVLARSHCYLHKTSSCKLVFRGLKSHLGEGGRILLLYASKIWKLYGFVEWLIVATVVSLHVLDIPHGVGFLSLWIIRLQNFKNELTKIGMTSFVYQKYLREEEQWQEGPNSHRFRSQHFCSHSDCWCQKHQKRLDVFLK